MPEQNLHSHPKAPPLPRRHPNSGGRGVLLVSLILLVASVGMVLEYSGIINFIPAFGRGGRPRLELGIWREADFQDLPTNFWARPFIEEMVQRDLIAGFPNQEFRPTQPMTRAEFAAIVSAAFGQNYGPQLPQASQPFEDVPSDLWAAPAIATVVETGFLSGYPDNRFQPQQPLSRVEALVALSTGLGLRAEEATEDILRTTFIDAIEIPSYARDAIAAATEAGLVVNHPDPKAFNPNQPATRADVSAFVYQALVLQNRAGRITSPYIVDQYIATRFWRF